MIVTIGEEKRPEIFPARPFGRVVEGKRDHQSSQLSKYVGVRWRKASAYNKGLVKLGAQKTLLPVVANDAPDGLGQALLDGKGEARAVVDKLAVSASIVLQRRWEAGGRGRRRLACPARRIHDRRLGDDLMHRRRVAPGGREDGRRRDVRG